MNGGESFFLVDEKIVGCDCVWFDGEENVLINKCSGDSLGIDSENDGHFSIKNSRDEKSKIKFWQGEILLNQNVIFENVSCSKFVFLKGFQIQSLMFPKVFCFV